MIRRKKRSTRHRHAVSYSSERSAPAAATSSAPEAPRTGIHPDRHADTGSRSYEAVYSISSGYTTDRSIVLP